MTSKDELNDIGNDEQEDISTDEQPANSSDSHKEKVAMGIARSEAKKFLQGEKKESEIPSWVREDAMQIANEIQGKDSKYEQLEKKIKELEEKANSTEKAINEKESKKVLNNFLKDYGIEENEFRKNHEEDFLSGIKKFEKAGFSRAEATEYILARIAKGYSKEKRDIVKNSSKLSLPSSSEENKNLDIKEVTESNIDRLSAEDLFKIAQGGRR